MFLLSVASLTIAGFLISKVWKKFTATWDELTSNESLQSINLRNHLIFVADISRRIAEDRMCIERSFTEGSAFHEHILKEVQSKQPSVQELISRELQEKHSLQDKQSERLFVTLRDLERDFTSVKCQIQHVTPSLMQLLEIKNQAFGTADDLTETEETDEGNCRIQEEVCSSKQVAMILKAAKENFADVVSENRIRGKEMIWSLSNFREKSQNEIQKEITLFSSVAAANGQNDREDSNFSLVNEVENIERHLQKTCIFLNRQRFNMENMNKTLIYFTKKFLHVAAKIDAFWQQSKASYGNLAQKLKDSDANWNSITEKIDSSTDKLLQESRNLVIITDDLRSIIQLRGNNVDFSFDLKMLENYAGDTRWNQRIDQLNQKLDDLLGLSENSSNKLSSIAEASSNVGNIYNLVNCMAEGYTTLLTHALSSIQKSKKTPFFSLDDSKEICSNLQTYNVRNNKMPIREDNFPIDDSLWDDVRFELKSEFPNQDIDNAIHKLKGTVHYTRDLVGDGKREIGGKTDVTDSEDGKVCKEPENDFWHCIPSESSLDAVTSDCLIQNSDESDKNSEGSPDA